MRVREYVKLLSRFNGLSAERLMPENDFLQHKKHWFPAKRYGWGWGVPVCWEGRAIVLIYMITLAQGARFVEDSPNLALLLTGCATTWLVAVCFWKGEAPRWRWGKDS